MIHEEICTYEVAKLAKEKGFRETVGWYYNTNGLNLLKRGCNGGNPNLINGLYSAPTQSLLQRWLREEKGYYVYPFFDNESRRWTWVCRELTGDMWIQLLDFEERYFDTYELALEDALKYALENLI